MSDSVSDMFIKFVSRLVFVLAVILLVPLAVQNRQIVTLQLNPLALLNDENGVTVSLPLFIFFILILFIGLVGGALFGWGVARLQHRKKAGKLARAVPPAPIPTHMKVLEEGTDATGAKSARANDGEPNG